MALNGPPWALMGRALMGLLGPLWAGPLRAPWALMGRAHMGPPWALIGRALMGQALRVLPTLINEINAFNLGVQCP